MDHAEEVSDFAEAVSGADVQFASLRYADLLRNWATEGRNSLADHAIEMQKRYNVALACGDEDPAIYLIGHRVGVADVRRNQLLLLAYVIGRFSERFGTSRH